jgi:DNA ligase-1
VRPELVVEIAIDGVQRSSRYAGGLALRFARVKRYREESIESDWLESQFAVDFKVVASSAGVILSSCLNTD